MSKDEQDKSSKDVKVEVPTIEIDGEDFIRRLKKNS